jgi:hypothetical protein
MTLRLAAALGCLCFLMGCTSSTSHSSAVPRVTAAASASDAPAASARALISPLPASSTALHLPVLCAPVPVGRQIAQLLADVNAGDGSAAARHFAADALWESYEHLNPPNGTSGGLASRADIKVFVQEVHGRGEKWTHGQLVSPVGSANLPEATGYGLAFTVMLDGTSRSDGGKVAVDCKSGLITHMVGPVGHRG